MNALVKECNVCGSTLDAPVYDSKSSRSLTSLCQLYPGPTQVWFCACCGHILSNSLEETNEYYATEYKMLIEHEEEDQIYEVSNGEIIYRNDHQLKVIDQKVSFKPGMKILDYGCAKAAMSKRLKEEMPDLDCHFFDVSKMYVEFWEKIAPRENHAIFRTPNDWSERFDVIISNFSLEHIPDPRKSVSHVASMLKETGVFYAIVPDTFGNKADFVVIDHVNHFTVSSLLHLLKQAGFSVVDIDGQAHRGALVVVAKKCGELTQGHRIENVQNKVEELADYWGSMAAHVKSAQAELGGPFAIYGSGFYGAFIYSQLGKN